MPNTKHDTEMAAKYYRNEVIIIEGISFVCQVTFEDIGRAMLLVYIYINRPRSRQ